VSRQQCQHPANPLRQTQTKQVRQISLKLANSQVFEVFTKSHYSSDPSELRSSKLVQWKIVIQSTLGQHCGNICQSGNISRWVNTCKKAIRTITAKVEESASQFSTGRPQTACLPITPPLRSSHLYPPQWLTQHPPPWWNLWGVQVKSTWCCCCIQITTTTTASSHKQQQQQEVSSNSRAWTWIYGRLRVFTVLCTFEIRLQIHCSGEEIN